MKVSDILLCGVTFAVALPLFVGIGASLMEPPEPKIIVREMTDEELAARAAKQVQATRSSVDVGGKSADICRAAIAALFGRDVGTIRVIDQKQGILTLSYIRPGDGTEWTNRCKLDGDRVVWAAYPDGRWRNHSLDDVIMFSSSGRSVTITMAYADGSKSVETYEMSRQ